MKKKKANKRRTSPSREKYEEANPTVSARIPKATRAKLRGSLRSLGLSLSDALKVLAGELEIKAKPLGEERKAGFEEAKTLYMVMYKCRKCGKPIPITNPKAKEDASKYMTEHGWGHEKCPITKPIV